MTEACLPVGHLRAETGVGQGHIQYYSTVKTRTQSRHAITDRQRNGAQALIEWGRFSYEHE